MDRCARQRLSHRSSCAEAFEAGVRAEPAAQRPAGELCVQVHSSLAHAALDDKSRRGRKSRVEQHAESGQRYAAIGRAAMRSVGHRLNHSVAGHLRPLDIKKVAGEMEARRAVRRQG